MKKTNNKRSDLEECKDRLNALLREYGCFLMSADECSNTLLIDKHTEESTLAQYRKD